MIPSGPKALYVFDLGYYDYGWWARLDAAGCRIVTRLKKNTPLSPVTELALPPGSGLLYDRIGHLPERLSSTRTNPFADPVREIGVMTETGTLLCIVTNDLDAPAEEIAARERGGAAPATGDPSHRHRLTPPAARPPAGGGRMPSVVQALTP